MKLGKLAPRIDPRVPMLDALLVGSMPAVPASCDWTAKLTGNPQFCNDALADCTIATIGHITRVWTSEIFGRELDIPDATIQSVYYGLTGGADTGLVETDVLAFWQATGIPLPDNQALDILTGWATINPWNHQHVKASTYLFGATYIGLNLPAYVEGLAEWIAPIIPPGQANEPLPQNEQPGSWGGHAVPIVAYDADSVTVLSWGQKIRASWAFLKFYMDEAHAPVSRMWLETTGMTPDGLDLAQLEAAMKRLTWAGP